MILYSPTGRKALGLTENPGSIRLWPSELPWIAA